VTDNGSKDHGEQMENPYQAMITAMDEFNAGTEFNWSGWTARLEQLTAGWKQEDS
jgi:hypothetical protein